MNYRIMIIFAAILCFVLAFGPATQLANRNDLAFIPVYTLIILGVLLVLLATIRHQQTIKLFITILCSVFLPLIFLTTAYNALSAQESKALYCTITYGTTGVGFLAEPTITGEVCSISQFSLENKSLRYSDEEIRLFILNNTAVLLSVLCIAGVLLRYKQKI